MAKPVENLRSKHLSARVTSKIYDRIKLYAEFKHCASISDAIEHMALHAVDRPQDPEYIKVSTMAQNKLLGWRRPLRADTLGEVLDVVVDYTQMTQMPGALECHTNIRGCKQTMTIKVDTELLAQLKALAAYSNRSVSDYTREFLWHHINRPTKFPDPERTGLIPDGGPMVPLVIKADPELLATLKKFANCATTTLSTYVREFMVYHIKRTNRGTVKRVVVDTGEPKPIYVQAGLPGYELFPARPGEKSLVDQEREAREAALAAEDLEGYESVYEDED